DERLALAVLLGAGGLADDHQLRFRVAAIDDHVCAGREERVVLQLHHGGYQVIQRGVVMGSFLEEAELHGYSPLPSRRQGRRWASRLKLYLQKQRQMQITRPLFAPMNT